jgi:AcrR family transcriptional regulator
MVLAEERGGVPFTIHEVVLRANVSLQTFYRHFSGKDELLLAVIEESVIAQIAAYRHMVVGVRDPVAQLERFVKGPFAPGPDALGPMVVREHLRLMEDYAREVRAADEPYRELVKGTIQAAQALDRFPEVDAERESEMIMALVVARFHNLELGVLGRSGSQEAEHVWEFCLGALTRWEGHPKIRARDAGEPA